MLTQIQLRNRDFIHACKCHAERLAADGGVPEVDAIVRLALADEAPSYYMDPEYALRRVRECLGGDRPEDSRLADFLSDIRAYMAETPDATLQDAVFAVCGGDYGSPRFYISLRQARYILRRHNKSLRKHL